MAKSSQPTEQAYAAAAWLLMCETQALKAVATVEAGPAGAFLPDGRPIVLFERHLFSRLTHGKFDHDRPDLSNPVSGGYGASGAHQHERLAAAAVLDREAAIKSASWGLFQILGLNHEAAGYPELQRFINAMYRSVDDQLRALVLFIRHDSRLVDAIREKDWVTFARIYNGPQFAINRYDSKLAAAYEVA
jgi:hypothetical protein